MDGIRTAGLALAIVLATLSQASGQTDSSREMVETFQVGGWSGGALYNDESYEACEVSTELSQRMHVTLMSKEPDYAIIMILINDDWRLSESEIYDLHLQVDRNAARNIRAKAVAENAIMMRLVNENGFFQSLKTGRTLNLLAAQRTYRLSLAGSAAALQRLARCHRDHSDVVIANPFKPGPAIREDQPSRLGQEQTNKVIENPFEPAPANKGNQPSPRAQGEASRSSARLPTDKPAAKTESGKRKALLVRDVPGVAAYLEHITDLFLAYTEIHERAKELDMLSKHLQSGKYTPAASDIVYEALAKDLTSRLNAAEERRLALPSAPEVQSEALRSYLSAKPDQLALFAGLTQESLVFAQAAYVMVRDGNKGLELAVALRHLDHLVAALWSELHQPHNLVLEAGLDTPAFYHFAAIENVQVALAAGTAAAERAGANLSSKPKFQLAAEIYLRAALRLIEDGEQATVGLEAMANRQESKRGLAEVDRELLKLQRRLISSLQYGFSVERQIVHETRQFVQLIDGDGVILFDDIPDILEKTELLMERRLKELEDRQTLIVEFQKS